MPLARAFLAFLVNHHHDFWDDVTGAAYDHRVADAHILAFQFVLIVQRGICHGYTAHVHRPQQRDRGDHTRAPDRGQDILDHGGFFLRRKFVRHRPARRACRKTETFTRGEAIHFVHHTVNFKRNIRAPGTDLRVVRQTIVHSAQGAKQIRATKSPVAQLFDNT